MTEIDQQKKQIPPIAFPFLWLGDLTPRDLESPRMKELLKVTNLQILKDDENKHTKTVHGKFWGLNDRPVCAIPTSRCKNPTEFKYVIWVIDPGFFI